MWKHRTRANYRALFEELENRAAIENSLEERFILVSRALDSIKKELTAFAPAKKARLHPIESKRLEANPVPQNASNTAAYKNNYYLWP